ncbi:MAG: transposase [Planctomycetaceae bacterium]|nr:transposase [Planctomycetaceae bacterium]
MKCSASDEAQVDFGTGAPIVSADGKRRKTNVFRIVLAYSRKDYSEATYTQTTDDFLRALENAFRHFGGVPKTLVIDNLKAAVSHPDHRYAAVPGSIPRLCRRCKRSASIMARSSCRPNRTRPSTRVRSKRASST